MEALAGCGCFRLAARIKELRQQGNDIKTKTLILPNGKIVAQYHLEVSKHEDASSPQTVLVFPWTRRIYEVAYTQSYFLQNKLRFLRIKNER